MSIIGIIHYLKNFVSSCFCGENETDENIRTQLWEFLPEIPTYPNARKESPGKGTC